MESSESARADGFMVGPFLLAVKRATDALDEVRRATWNDARIALGFKPPDALITLVMLNLGATNRYSLAGFNPRLRQESPKSLGLFAINYGRGKLREYPFGDVYGEEASGKRVRSPPRRVCR